MYCGLALQIVETVRILQQCKMRYLLRRVLSGQDGEFDTVMSRSNGGENQALATGMAPVVGAGNTKGDLMDWIPQLSGIVIGFTPRSLSKFKYR